MGSAGNIGNIEKMNNKIKTEVKKETDLTQGSILDKVLMFAIPLALTSMLQQLFNATDIAVVGKFASKEAMAAVGSNAPIVSLMVNFFVGLSVGANVIIARNIGAKNFEKAKSAVGTAMSLALISGVTVAALGNLIAGPIVDLLGVPAEVRAYSILYLRIYFAGMPFIMLYNFEAAIFRSAGNTRTPLICLFTGGVLNVGANLFFVIVLGMDVDGVAIATVLANVVSSMMLLYFLRREEGVIHVDLRAIKIDRQILISIAKIGLPAGLQGAVFSLSNLCMQSAINSLGADYMAASSAAYNIEMAVYFFINAFGQALTTFVGQHCGAGKYDRCRTVIRRTMLMSWAFTVGLSILMLIAARPALSLFTDDATVLDIAVTRVKILLYGETFNVIMDNLSGVMRGLGKSFAPALISVIGVCGVRITWVFTGFKIYHSWVPLMLLFPISWAITAAIIAIIYFKDRKTLLPAE